MMGLGREKVYTAIAKGAIPSIRVDGSILVPIAAIRKWIDDAIAGNKTPIPRRSLRERLALDKSDGRRWVTTREVAAARSRRGSRWLRIVRLLRWTFA
jgi:hypothetical protein